MVSGNHSDAFLVNVSPSLLVASSNSLLFCIVAHLLLIIPDHGFQGAASLPCDIIGITFYESVASLGIGEETVGGACAVGVTCVSGTVEGWVDLTGYNLLCRAELGRSGLGRNFFERNGVDRRGNMLGSIIMIKIMAPDWVNDTSRILGRDRRGDGHGMLSQSRYDSRRICDVHGAGIWLWVGFDLPLCSRVS